MTDKNFADNGVGIVACSNALKSESKEENQRLVGWLEANGRKVFLSNCIYENEGILSGTGKEKADELMKLFLNPEIQNIFDISGGDLANQLLDYLDFEKIKNSQAVFWGYSDLTTIINSIYSQTGKASVLYQIKNVVQSDFHEVQQKRFLYYFLHQDELFNPEFRFIQGKSMKGIVVGGNLRCFLKLAGTKYFPDLTDKILLMESMGGKSPRMITYLSQLKSMGAFSKIKGILLGTFSEMEKYNCQPDIISLVQSFAGSEIPIAKTEEIGHGKDSKAIWIGKEIEL